MEAIQILLELVQGLGIEYEQTLAAGASAMHQARTLQHTQVLGDRLTRQPRPFGKLSDGMTPAVGKPGEQPETRLVA